MHQQAEKQLEQLSGMSAEEAKKQLVEALKDEAKTAAMSYINEIMDNARLEANKEAKKIIIQTIQRVVISVLSRPLPAWRSSWTTRPKLSPFPLLIPYAAR